MWKATPSTDARGRRGLFRLALACALAVTSGAACVETAAPSPPEQPPAPPPGPPLQFSFETTDGGRLESGELRGRLTVIALVATYDFTSQAQLKVLGLVQRNHKPRVNVAAVVLEPPENRPLVDAFAHGLDLKFPIALADAPTIEGHGPFGELRAVPSLVILDREGREVYQHVGPLDEKPLRAELDRLDARR
jgi:hypothetical protein